MSSHDLFAEFNNTYYFIVALYRGEFFSDSSSIGKCWGALKYTPYYYNTYSDVIRSWSIGFKLERLQKATYG